MQVNEGGGGLDVKMWKKYLRLAFACEGGGVGETLSKHENTTSGLLLHVREVVVVRQCWNMKKTPPPAWFCMRGRWCCGGGETMLKCEKKHHIQLAFACEGGGVGETLSKREKTPPLVSGKSNRKIRKEYGHSSTGYCDHIQHTWWVFHCMDLPSQFPPSTRMWQCHCGCCSSWGSSMICLAWRGHIETFDHVCNGQGGSGEVLKVNVQRPRNNVPCLLGQLYESSTVPQCHLLAAGAHHVGKSGKIWLLEKLKSFGHPFELNILYIIELLYCTFFLCFSFLATSGGNVQWLWYFRLAQATSRPLKPWPYAGVVSFELWFFASSLTFSLHCHCLGLGKNSIEMLNVCLILQPSKLVFIYFSIIAVRAIWFILRWVFFIQEKKPCPRKSLSSKSASSLSKTSSTVGFWGFSGFIKLLSRATVALNHHPIVLCGLDMVFGYFLWQGGLLCLHG